MGGRRQHCSFVFSDMVGFTTMMENSEATDVVSLLNGYLEKMIKIAFRHEGTLDRIVGDAVAIMFSAPREQADHPARALACALEMHRFASAYAQDLNRQGVAFGHTRIGVHCGEVVVGNFGGATIFDYRALGDPVNTASRLEGLNQTVGTLVCVSGAIHACCPDVPMRPVAKVVLKGKAAAVDVYEPLSAQPALPRSLQAMDGTGEALPVNQAQTSAEAQYQHDYQLAYTAMAGARSEALAAFENLHARRPADSLVAFHLARLQEGQNGELLVMTGK
ncbi:MAG: adenylate/guanylate cyclase domain-containing protein [Janthinobacterium lividum]